MIDAAVVAKLKQIFSKDLVIITARADQPSMRGPADIWIFDYPSQVNPNAVFTITRTKQRK